MVPHSSTPQDPGARALSEQTALVLREAVRRTVARSTAVGSAHPAAPSSFDGDRALREAVAAVVAEARERRMHPEELIPAFKALLDAIPEVNGAGNGRLDEARLRERLVTLCIKAYYQR